MGGTSRCINSSAMILYVFFYGKEFSVNSTLALLVSLVLMSFLLLFLRRFAPSNPNAGRQPQVHNETERRTRKEGLGLRELLPPPQHGRGNKRADRVSLTKKVAKLLVDSVSSAGRLLPVCLPALLTDNSLAPLQIGMLETGAPEPPERGHRPTNRRLTGWLSGWQVGWGAGWLDDWLVGWLSGWLSG